MPHSNPEDRRAYKREWYRRNSKKVVDEVAERKRRIVAQLQAYKDELECSICGEDEACCLDFHHTNNDKECAVSNMACNGYSWERILKEIQKCVVVCRNCHAKLHAGIVSTEAHQPSKLEVSGQNRVSAPIQ